MRGTSQATAMQTGLEINKLLQNKEKWWAFNRF
jgi:hypothetical protein